MFWLISKISGTCIHESGVAQHTSKALTLRRKPWPLGIFVHSPWSHWDQMSKVAKLYLILKSNKPWEPLLNLQTILFACKTKFTLNQWPEINWWASSYSLNKQTFPMRNIELTSIFKISGTCLHESKIAQQYLKSSDPSKEILTLISRKFFIINLWKMIEKLVREILLSFSGAEKV